MLSVEVSVVKVSIMLWARMKVNVIYSSSNTLKVEVSERILKHG